MPVCRKCKTEYPIDYFSKSSSYKNGYDTLCKLCKSIQDRQYRQVNKQQIRNKRIQKYNTEKKPISHDAYISKMKSDPFKWRAQCIRNGMILRSKEKGLEFDCDYFSTDLIMNNLINNSNCQCCGRVFDMLSLQDNRKKNNAAPSVDRLDNSKGYVKGNVVLICWRCNNLKSDSSIEKLENIVRWLGGKKSTS